MAPTKTKTPAQAAKAGAPKLRADARRNREAVLVAARKRFAKHGLESQMEDIARAAGVGVGTIYRHFPTKEDLLQALADERFGDLAEAARRALDDPDPWGSFADFMRYSAEVMAGDRALSEAMDQRPGTCREAAERAGLPELTAALVERAKQAGALREGVVADDVPSLICGLGRATRPSEGAPPPMSWERYLEIMLDGLRAPKERR